MRFILTIDIAPIIKYTCLYTFYERSFHIMANDDKSNGKIKSFLKSRWGELAVLGVLSAFALLFTVIFYSVKFTDYRIAGIERADVSLWTADIFYLEN